MRYFPKSAKIALAILSLFVLAGFSVARAATLSLEPTSGTFVVGSTFNVPLFLDTEDELVNAIKAEITFPPDKLQVVSASTEFSIVNQWLSNPSYSNRSGVINLEGIIPSGIFANKGLVTTITFRARSVGAALVKITDQSQVILGDGRGTNALYDVTNGIYNLVLPPPSGPVVVSETHQDQSRWYSNPHVVLKWATDNEVDGFSYVLNSEPTDIPDDISEGTKTNAIYKDLPSGTYYFHIKALRNGVWGGTTHFALNIDLEPPADFPIDVKPSKITISQNPIISFQTTDALSGIGQYEYKIVSLNPGDDAENQNFFIEFSGQQVLSLDRGDYDIIARAYDKAGNIREVAERLVITSVAFLVIRSYRAFVFIFAVFVLGLAFWAVRAHRWHAEVHRRHRKKEIPSDVRDKLRKLKKYQKKYGKLTAVLLAAALSFGFFSAPVSAQTVLSPPFVTSVSKNISNEEIFYIGGKTEAPRSEVIIYLQNLQTGETQSFNVTSNQKGDWFYRHPGFLSTGGYLMWAQAKIGNEMSPPSPQIQMTVRQTALQFGSSRISFETLYLTSSIILLLFVIGLSLFIGFHFYHGKKKLRVFKKEVGDIEGALERGFAVLKRDLELELAAVREGKKGKKLSAAEARREQELLQDLKDIEEEVGKELRDLENPGHLE